MIARTMATGGKATPRVCPKGHECPDLKRVMRAFDLVEGNVLNVYLVGSHLWGTCHKDSDWDLVIVLEKLTSEKPLNIHRGNLEAFILSRASYTTLIKEHSMQVLLTLWLPNAFVMREEFNPRTVFRFNKSLLVKALDHSRERDTRIAEKHFRKSDQKQGRKVALHCIRYLVLGAQLKRSGAIEDYSGAEVYRGDVVENYCTQWEEFVTCVQPIVEELWTEITS